MKTEIKYIISIIQEDGEVSEIIYSFSNPFYARRLAIKELQKVLQAASRQLNAQRIETEYGIKPWDNPNLIREIPEINNMLRPLSIELILDLEGTQYTLFGESRNESFEALIAESAHYLENEQLDFMNKFVYENEDYQAGIDDPNTQYYLNKEMAYGLHKNISKHLVIEEYLMELVGYQ